MWLQFQAEAPQCLLTASHWQESVTDLLVAQQWPLVAQLYFQDKQWPLVF
jgi:hypothetical protein